MLDAVDVHLPFGITPHQVDAPQPCLGFLQILRTRRDDEDGLEARVGHEANNALGGTVLIIGEDCIQLLRDRLRIARFDREQAE